MATKAKSKAPAKKTATKAPVQEKAKFRTESPAPSKDAQKDFINRQRKELENAKRQGGGGDFWSAKVPRSVIRIFQFEHKGRMELFVQETRHWQIDGNPKSSVGCGGQSCPICALKDDVDKDFWGKIRPQSTFLVNAVVRGIGDGNTDKQVVASLKKTAYTQLMAYVTGEEELDDMGPGDCLDHRKGMDFRLSRSGQGFDTKYTVVPMPKATPIGVNVVPANLFDKVKAAPSDDELQKIADAIREM